jgi:thymidylate synthase
MFYVVKQADTLEDAIAKGQYSKFSRFQDAKEFAEVLKKDTNVNRSIHKVEWAWTTQTLAECLEKREQDSFSEASGRV